MAKQMLFDDEARRKILNGVTQLARAVKTTMGPKGRNVVMDGPNGPTITKDGVSVAKDIVLEDPFENMGAQMVIEVASRTAGVAGDGTTTATVLAEAIYTEGLKIVTAGVNPMAVKRGIDKAIAIIVEELDNMSVQIDTTEQIKQIATISANGDEEIGGLIAEAMEEVGKDGTITVAPSNTMDTTLDVVDGMQFNRGLLSPYFANSEDGTANLDDAYVLIYNKKISNVQEILPLLQAINGEGKPLLIIAEDVEADALSTLVLNRMRGTLNVCAVKAPGLGDQRQDVMEDIAILTGGTCVTEESGITLENLTLDNLGSARNIKVGKSSTTIVDGDGDSDAIEARADAIRLLVPNAESSNEHKSLLNRLAKMAGGVAVLSVGASTELELLEKKDRVDDALQATRAAVEEGIVAGGGTALVRAKEAIKQVVWSIGEDMGADIVYKAVDAPLRQLISNAGGEPSVVINAVMAGEGAYGYNVATDEYCDLIAEGVIDPKKVTRSALQHAGSVSGLMLTTECMITDIPSDKPEPPMMGGMGGMGGMPGMM
jgi:chaperonin GroEL